MNADRARLWVVIVVLTTFGLLRMAEGDGPAVNQTTGMGTIVHPYPDAGAGNANGTETFGTVAKKVGCPPFTKAITITPPTGGTIKCAFSGPDVNTVRDPTICGSGCDQSQFSAAISELYGFCEMDAGVACKVNCGI